MDVVTGRQRRRAPRAAALLAVVSAVVSAVVLALLAGCSNSAAGIRATEPLPRSSVPPPGPPSASPSPSPSPTSSPVRPWRAAGRQPFTPVRSDVGRLLVTTLQGARSGVRMRVWVWLPPQYDDRRNAGLAFPALMLYPGGSGAGYNTWTGKQYGGKEYVAAHGTPFVLVMPEMQLSEQLDTECADLPGRPKVGTFLAVDVRRTVEAEFRVRRDRAGWGAAGASSGGYCATRLVMNHPGEYAAAVSISGYFHLETGLAGARTPAVLAQDPDALARSTRPGVALLLWAGGRDPYDLQQNRDFLALVRAPTRARLSVLTGGRHLTSDFARTMPGTFAFLGEQLGGLQPVSGG